jgi:ABC-type Fe3+/spermidine/putrescine transport system ATPase subunit
MNAGRIEQIGTQTDIYLHPQTPFVAEFIGANNSLVGKVSRVESAGETSRVAVVANGLTLYSNGQMSFKEGDSVLAYIRPENVIILNDSEGKDYENILEGVIDRVIFEGATAQLRVDVAGREFRADVSGGQRLTLIQRHGKVRLGFNEVTLIPVSKDVSS